MKARDKSVWKCKIFLTLKLMKFPLPDLFFPYSHFRFTLLDRLILGLTRKFYQMSQW